jgi:hypothetical protein
VHTLELITGLMAVCVGGLHDKTQFIFDCFDFNRGGDISYDEMIILCQSVLSGMVKISRFGVRVGDAAMESIVDSSFLAANRTNTGAITSEEFFAWVMTDVAKGLDHELTVPDVISHFGLTEEALAAGLAAKVAKVKKDEADTAKAARKKY